MKVLTKFFFLRDVWCFLFLVVIYPLLSHYPVLTDSLISPSFSVATVFFACRMILLMNYYQTYMYILM